jgi:hypothetical protein
MEQSQHDYEHSSNLGIDPKEPIGGMAIHSARANSQKDFKSAFVAKKERTE